MRFLADVGVARSTVFALRERGHDVEHLVDIGLNKLPDPSILERAASHGRAIITFDLDFGDLIASGVSKLPSLVIARLADQRPSSATPKIVAAIQRFETDLAAGALIVVEDGRCRVRRLPLR